MSIIVHPFEKPIFKIAKQNESKTEGEFVIDPLERGLGQTIGNAFRRSLLTNLPGASVYGINIQGVLHEFTTIDGVEEDVTMIILNLKDLILRIDDETEATKILTLDVHGPCVVTAGDIQLPSDVEVINPELELFNVAEGGHVSMEIYAKNGRGYVTNDENKAIAKQNNDPQAIKVGFIATDSNYSPIKKVNFTVEDARVKSDSNFDKLKLTVQTNGSMSPADAISLSARILISHFEKFNDLESVIAANEIFKEEEVEEKPTFTDQSIDDLNLSTRSQNCLKRSGYETVRDLLAISEDELKSIHNLGKKSYQEIQEKLAELGFKQNKKISNFEN